MHNSQEVITASWLNVLSAPIIVITASENRFSLYKKRPQMAIVGTSYQNQIRQPTYQKAVAF